MNLSSLKGEGDLLTFLQIGFEPYDKVWSLQKEKHLKISEMKSEPQCIIITEHPSVITMGHRDHTTDFLSNVASIHEQGISIFKTERGGGLTAHESGQLVVYPILRVDFKERSAKKLVWLLEEVVILSCAEFGLNVARRANHPGIWVGELKLGSIGLRVKEKVTFHGFSLNVCNDLSTFKHIIPCSSASSGLTTMSRQLGRKLSIEDVVPKIIQNFRRLFT